MEAEFLDLEFKYRVMGNGNLERFGRRYLERWK
jgi:hypothetical protein